LIILPCDFCCAITLYLGVDEVLLWSQVLLEDIQNDFLSLLAVAASQVSPSHQSQSCHYLNNNTETMESQQLPQPEYVSPSPEALPTSQPSPLAKLPPASLSDEAMAVWNTNLPFFGLPDYLGRFFNDYKRPVPALL